MNNKIICLIGISGSGKSTKATELQLLTRNSIVVSRDKLREMLFSYDEKSVVNYYSRPDFKECEEIVSKYEYGIIRQALTSGVTVIVDETHLQMRYINKLKKFGVDVEFVLMECDDLEECVRRDSLRVRQVGREIIRRQWVNLQHLKSVFDFQPFKLGPIWKYEYNSVKKNKCYIFDIDGTLANHHCVRSPYDYSKVSDDKVIQTIQRLNWDLSSGRCIDIIICSGRDSSCREATEKWLNDNLISYDKLYMRKEDDSRPDWQIKQEFWELIAKDYEIICCFDDRNQIIDRGRACGITMAQVNYGDF